MGDINELQELLVGRDRYQTLSDVFKACLKRIKSLNSLGGGRLDQLVRTDEHIHDKGHRIKVRIFPSDVEIEYDSETVVEEDTVFASIDDISANVPTLMQEVDTSTLVDELISIRGSSARERQFRNRYSIRPDGSMEGKGVGDITADVMSAYFNVLFEQVISSFGAEGVLNLTAENIGLPNIKRRISLSHVENFMDSKGETYSLDRFVNRILDVMTENFIKIQPVLYNRFYMYGRSLLIDCGSHDLISDVASQDFGSQDELRVALDLVFSGQLDTLCVYEHDDAAITLVDKVFPDSGDVFMYPMVEGVVRRLFSCYALRSNPSAHIDQGWLVFDGRDLRIQFLGNIGEAEFREQAAEYVRQRPVLEASRMMTDLLGY